ncbi:hypothetical protein K431DRAFT_127058 [Polychaeton citri CBS 116435]|uniref:Uncharacterized protein n=1 Tax=Polychaeton citri CBS 116435 TaxID=1314669 RepID=A0A9P4UMT2_9PEZI|nr:hypothetical protein K431DRAFT_127058 [Polychaeton citri CBS 116435]
MTSSLQCCGIVAVRSSGAFELGVAEAVNDCTEWCVVGFRHTNIVSTGIAAVFKESVMIQARRLTEVLGSCAYEHQPCHCCTRPDDHCCFTSFSQYKLAEAFPSRAGITISQS